MVLLLRSPSNRAAGAGSAAGAGGARRVFQAFQVMKGGVAMNVPPGGTISIDDTASGSITVTGSFEYRHGPSFAQMFLFAPFEPRITATEGTIQSLPDVGDDWFDVNMSSPAVTWAPNTFNGGESFALRSDLVEVDATGLGLFTIGTADITVVIIETAKPAEFRSPTFDFQV